MLIEMFSLQTSVQAIAELFKDEPYFFILESSQYHQTRGRYTFIGFDPFDVLSVHNASDLSQLEEKYSFYSSGVKSEVTPFPAGMFGFLTYDFGLKKEGVRSVKPEDESLPDFAFGFYDCILTIDQCNQKLYVTSTGLPERDDELRELKAKARMASVCERLNQEKSVSESDEHICVKSLPMQQGMSRDEYLAKVRRALEHIADGDIYQINLAQRFFVRRPEEFDPWSTYRFLMQASPSGFSGFCDFGEHQMISSSPERFLHLQGKYLQTRPMKGTRPRGETVEQDALYESQIYHSPKEKAELLMITDLLRNDLGRVCRYGSVRVKELRAIEKYSTVFQATSTIEGELQEGRTPFDILNACFPGGSITGCPKIRAMWIIEELEPHRRGVYTGTMGYISFSGNMDFNIMIRTILCSSTEVSYQVGSGIVADSDPETEYAETMVKARAMNEALGFSSSFNQVTKQKV